MRSGCGAERPDHAKRFAERHGVKAMDAESAVEGVDVVVTATNARQPVLKGRWLKRGAHVNSVGSQDQIGESSTMKRWATC